MGLRPETICWMDGARSRLPPPRASGVHRTEVQDLMGMGMRMIDIRSWFYFLRVFFVRSSLAHVRRWDGACYEFCAACVWVS